MRELPSIFKSLKNKKEIPLKCSVCGRFVSYADLASGKASNSMVTPDSDLSFETWETLCPKHNKCQY